MTLVPRRHASILPDIVGQHAEEAAFLWLLRDAAVDAPHYARRHLARLEERVEAHVDGLRVAGEPGFEIAMAQLDRFQEAGELFAAGVLALESGNELWLQPVLEIARSVPDAEHGLFGAIGWLRKEHLRLYVRPWLDSPDPFERRLGLVACSLHRADPKQRLAPLLKDTDPLVRARALRLAGELGRVDLAERAAEAVAQEDAYVVFWAAWAAGLLGIRDIAIPPLEVAAESGGPAQGPALELAARLMAPSRAAAWVRTLNADQANHRLVVRALGAIGDPAAVPWLIGRMSDPALARLAGESFSLITGVDIAFDDLEGETPEGVSAGPTEDPADPRVALDEDENLPWPDPDLVTAWWEDHGDRFRRGTRHLLGRTLDGDAAEAAFAQGFQSQRRAASYEIALMHADTKLPNWRSRVRTG
jgi:uncharacterized protein (TIGR02270 family)